MNTWQIIVGVLMIIVSVIIIAVVLLQQGRRSGIGAISGGADTFFSKNKARDVDAIVSRLTKYVAIAFFVIAIAATAIALATK